jgi:type I restriction enzyme S subunit
MAGEWRASTWGEEISLEYGKALRDYDKVSGKYRVFGSNGPIGWTDKPLASGPGVILGRKGAYRGIEFSRAPFFVIDTAYYVVPKSEFEMRWLYYAIKYHKLGEIDDGSPIPSTTRSAVYVKDFDVPPLAEQKAIAAVLGALDDKIELNRRMNATLEAMARALFQSWFVDFDPVRLRLSYDGQVRPSKENPTGLPAEALAKAGLDPATAALFPDSFDETAIGRIPHGWEVKTLGEVIELAYGKPLKAEDRKNGPVCVYGANGPVGWHDEKLVSGPGIVVGRKGNPGVVTWAHGDFYPIDTTFYVEPIGACRSLYFYYYALSLHNLANLSADSAVPGLNRNHAYMSKQVIPSQPVLKAFDSQISPIFATINANEEQSRTLATLRDTLLPKLLSGELSVAEVEPAKHNEKP